MTETTQKTLTDRSPDGIQRIAYSVTEAAKMIGVGRNGAYQLIKSGELPSVVIGGRIRVPRDGLLRMVNGKPQIEPEKVEGGSVTA